MKRVAKWIAESWAEEFKTVLQFLTSEDWTVNIAEPDDPAASASSYFWWTQKFNAGPACSVAIGAPPLAWSELGARVLQAAGVELIEQTSARSTYLEAVQQSAGGVARSLSERLSKSVEPADGRDQAPDEPGQLFVVTVSSGEFELPALRISISEGLCFLFHTPDIMAPVQIQETSLSVTTPPSRTMSVLLDVQMPVSISFGKASMPLRDVMKLATGSAVELDRKPDDNVDIIVNNCVIARGEVVVVEGNYAVRITEIISREQRLALRGGARAC